MSSTPAGTTPSPVAKRFVVTGAAGFIGSHIVDRLLADGHRVDGVDCFTDYYPRPVKERNLEAARTHRRFRLHEADLRTADLDEILDGADVVVHEAAMGGLKRSWTEFESYMTCNVLGTQRLLEAARRVSIGLLVHASTSSIYGRESSGPEDQPKRPDSPYGITKLAAENMVLAYGRNFDIPVTVLRYFSIYGPRQRPDMGYHIFIDRILRGEPITIFGDGSQTRGNTYIGDCVEATVRAAGHGPTGRAFNIGGGEEISAIGAVRLIEEITGREARLEFGPPRRGEQRHALADTTRAAEAFGWRPTMPIEDGLAQQVAWHRERVLETTS